MLVVDFRRNTRCYIVEDRTEHIHRYENSKFNKLERDGHNMCAAYSASVNVFGLNFSSFALLTLNSIPDLSQNI
jgi:hypothetical protein